ncbi:putative fungal specific transcription factor [Erysiphe neolycopersici]|uniref:Putative fungal specific transcription factor n=1 Tax=Erysiphe neolycopersici TaxID=212602 RepID=A0A420HPV0_9PEZI|nr:putative fungal specific transcription factor [Erysiphe neolycopersici]
MSMFGGQSAENITEAQLPKAPQACMSCRKQKRKCSKTLPACALCHRMGRHCDYSDSAPAPTSEDFHALRMKLAELESKLKYSQRGLGPNFANSGAHGSLCLQGDQLGQFQQISDFSHLQEPPWLGIPNRFPSLALLDGIAFSNSGTAAPRPNFSTPPEILEKLGSGLNFEAITNNYFVTIHQWIPILSKKRLTKYLAKPQWELLPDVALLYLCIKLVISKPKDGLDCSQNELYLAAKRFINFMQSTGFISILVLQANILVTLFEYGHAIYPAAWMSSGWSVRYGNLLGINGDEAAIDLLGKPSDEIDQEERLRTWWAILCIDRILSIGNMAYIINPQEPKEDDILPIDDDAWERGEISSIPRMRVSTPFNVNLTSFPRLCQAYILMGQAMLHHKDKLSSEKIRFTNASQLQTKILELMRKIKEESLVSRKLFSLISPLALTYSSLCLLCNPYCGFGKGKIEEQKQIKKQAITGLETVAVSIIDFADQINIATQTMQDLDHVSPFIVEGIYFGSLTLARLYRGNREESYQASLGPLRQCLRKLSTRWRIAADCLRILESHDIAVI